MAESMYGSVIELQFINYIFQKNSFQVAILNDITEQHFTTYKEHFVFIRDFYNQYNQLPSKETFQGKFGDRFEWLTISDPEEYLVSKLNEAKLYRDLIVDYKKFAELIKDEKSDKAVEKMAEISQKYMKQKQGKCIDLISDAHKRFDSYMDRVNNPATSFVTTGIKELDDIFGGWDLKNESAVIAARSGVGKCHEKGTLVLMADGTHKAVEDIKVGDKVQSINGVNTVFQTHNGVSSGYRIVPSNGNPFVVSSDHVLSLWKRNVRYHGHKAYTDGTGAIVDIKIEDFMSLSNRQKRLYTLVRPAIDYSEKKLAVDPYILGIWLGDGTSCRPEITSMDNEVINEWCIWAKSHGAVAMERHSRGKAHVYDITYGKASKFKPNKVKGLLKDIGVLNNKHIPLLYLTSSRKQRLELLAGLLDTDGYLCDGEKGYELALKNTVLVDNVIQLVHGLGFKVSVHDKVVNETTYKRIHISGQLCNIPCKVVRKQANNFSKHTKKDYTHIGFHIENVDRVEYYGFACDGDHRFLLADCTLSHNSWYMIKFALEAAKQGLRVGFYSGEMDVDQVGYRLDTFLGNIPNGSLTHGNSNVEDQYRNYIEEINKVVRGNIFVITPDMIGGTMTVSKLRAFIEKYDLQMLFIDQLSLMHDERNARSAWEQMSNISKDLRTLQRLKKIPIICAAQLNREEYEEGVNTKNIGGSDRVGQDATLVLFIERKGDNVILTIGKARNAKTGDKLTYYWNTNMGILNYIPSENDAKKGADTDSIAQYNDTQRSNSVF